MAQLWQSRHQHGWLLGDRGERAVQFSAGADSELGEHLAQVVLDGARTDEQLRGYLRIRLPVARHARDLSLLGCQDIARPHRALGRSLTCRHQLTPSALSEPRAPDLAEHLVGAPELLARVHASVLTPQPFAVGQTGPGDVNHASGAPK